MKPKAEGSDHRPASSGDILVQLQVLRDEQEVSGGYEDGEEVDREGGVERPDGEEPDVDHRVLEPLLTACEDRAWQAPGRSQRLAVSADDAISLRP